MILQAKSGTGKTLAFAICLLENYDDTLKYPQSLVVVPTREIAVQIVSVLNDLGRNMKHFKSCEFIGGTDVSNDRKKIQSAKVVVGTPGRIFHLIKSEIFNISCLRTLVLDEADKLLEGGQMGKDVMSILKLMHKKIQILATTATVTKHLEKVMKQVMKNPIGVTPKHEIPVLLGIKQFVKVIPRENDNIALMNNKIDELQKIFTRITFKQCLLFTDSQSKTESYGNYLNKRGWKNEVINGAQDQAQRLHVLDNLIKFKCRILITTDLMARGIDIENINLIINLDLPYDCFTYLHRIGRAGRFGTHGIAITFVNGEEDLMKYQKMLGDIGGQHLKALKYPEESTQYDFWNFEDENILETVAGFSKDSEDESSAVKNINNSSSNQADETTMNNLALLEITRKLVDDRSKEAKPFDLNAIIEDYEKTSSPSVERTHEKSTNGKAQSEADEENIFMKTIEELGLYDDETKDDHPTPVEVEEPPKVEKPVRQIIFKRTNQQEDDDEIMSEASSSEFESESSDSGEESEETGASDEEETTSEEEEETHPETFQQTGRQNETSSNVGNQDLYASYNHYVANSYSQWENIYCYQLANIQNYLHSARK